LLSLKKNAIFSLKKNTNFHAGKAYMQLSSLRKSLFSKISMHFKKK